MEKETMPWHTNRLDLKTSPMRLFDCAMRTDSFKDIDARPLLCTIGRAIAFGDMSRI